MREIVKLSSKGAETETNGRFFFLNAGEAQ